MPAENSHLFNLGVTRCLTACLTMRISRTVPQSAKHRMPAREPIGALSEHAGCCNDFARRETFTLWLAPLQECHPRARGVKETLRIVGSDSDVSSARAWREA